LGDYCNLITDVNDCANYAFTCNSDASETNDWFNDVMCDDCESCGVGGGPVNNGPRRTNANDCVGY
jgi:hypothetical protein